MTKGMTMKPIDVKFSAVRPSKLPRWGMDEHTLLDMLRLLGMFALYGLVFYALIHDRAF
jgi:hypothetical protein